MWPRVFIENEYSTAFAQASYVNANRRAAVALNGPVWLCQRDWAQAAGFHAYNRVFQHPMRIVYFTVVAKFPIAQKQVANIPRVLLLNQGDCGGDCDIPTM
jgi:hypothetical protein